jgi:4'-phosphopantetheinyl transferase
MSSRPEGSWWPASESPGAGARAGPAGIDVWHVGLDPGPRTAAAAAAVITAAERRRVGQIRDARAARRYLVAHGALRLILGEYLRRPGAEVRWDTGTHGKPVFAGPDGRWQWSLSRSDGHALLAVTLSAAVGIDLEAIRADLPESALAGRFLPPQEAAAVREGHSPFVRRVTYQRLLTRKEACAKASGGRFLDALRLNVLQPGAVRGAGRLDGQHWTLVDLPVPPGFAGALAVTAAGTGPVRLLDWAAPPGPPAAGWPPDKVPPCCRANRLAASGPSSSVGYESGRPAAGERDQTGPHGSWTVR